MYSCIEWAGLGVHVSFACGVSLSCLAQVPWPNWLKRKICPTHLSLGGNRSPVGSPVTVEEPVYGHHILPCAGDSTRHQVSPGGSGREPASGVCELLGAIQSITLQGYRQRIQTKTLAERKEKRAGKRKSLIVALFKGEPHVKCIYIYIINESMIMYPNESQN